MGTLSSCGMLWRASERSCVGVVDADIFVRTLTEGPGNMLEFRGIIRGSLVNGESTPVWELKTRKVVVAQETTILNRGDGETDTLHKIQQFFARVLVRYENNNFIQAQLHRLFGSLEEALFALLG